MRSSRFFLKNRSGRHAMLGGGGNWVFWGATASRKSGGVRVESFNLFSISEHVVIFYHPRCAGLKILMHVVILINKLMIDKHPACLRAQTVIQEIAC